VDKVSQWYLLEMAMTLRLNPETDSLLNEVAEDLGISKQQALAIAVNEFIEKRHQKLVIKRVVAEVLERDRVLLDRLADA
jgi:predicted transcriptional regulator